MFSYTDDAIVTSSPTGRHLSTVIRRPAAIGPLDWAEHAEEVCQVLNDLGRAGKAADLREVFGVSQFHDEVQIEVARAAGEETPGSVEYAIELNCGPQKGQGTFVEVIGNRGSRIGRLFPEGAEAESKALYEELQSGFSYGPPMPFSEAERKLQIDRRDALIEALERELADAHEKLKARRPMPSASSQREENLSLRLKLADATTKLGDAQMLLEKPIRLNADAVLRILNLETDTAIEVDGRTLARVE